MKEGKKQQSKERRKHRGDETREKKDWRRKKRKKRRNYNMERVKLMKRKIEVRKERRTSKMRNNEIGK